MFQGSKGEVFDDANIHSNLHLLLTASFHDVAEIATIRVPGSESSSPCLKINMVISQKPRCIEELP